MIKKSCAFFALMLCASLFSQVRVVVHEHRDYDEEQLKKLEQVKTLLENIINSEEFKNEVLAMKVSEDNNPDHLTNQQIYDIIMKADEVAYPNSPNVIDLNLRMKPIPFYKPFTSVVGYTYPGINYIVTYRGKFNDCKLYDLASHYAHEWTHKLGFGHEDKKTWDFSVPYLVDDIVEKLGKKKVNGNQ